MGADVELKHTSNDTPVVNFSIATDESYGSGVDKVEKTEWHHCTAWKKTAEIIAQICHKGDKVYVKGSLQTRSWQDKEGVNKETTEIVVRDVINFKKKDSIEPDADPNDLPF